MKAILIFLVLLSLSACSTAPITGPSKDSTGAPIQATGILISPASPAGIDLQDVAFNLDEAVRVGVLSPNDPAPKCVHDALQQAGIEAPAGSTPGESFTPKDGGLLSKGSVLYIKAQQLKGALGKQIVVSVNCKALIGQFAIDGLSVQNRVLDPLHLLPSLK